MSNDMGFNQRNIDLVINANQRTDCATDKRITTDRADLRQMINKSVRIIAELAIVRRVPSLGTSGTRVLALGFPVC
ncbi:hypothetical protein [Brucella intermedia]|uniref:hypothetical protein n=1 Tax=Brucella intermedia TaxID=94625 RepID=UPI002362D920|nr:hypothetical protein [Brucella intermedia]